MLLLGSCFTNNWLITVKPDGSGTINMNFSMDQSVIGMMQGMTGGSGDPPPQSSADLIDPAEMQEIAAAMGEGVSFVSASPVDKSGSLGYNALFSFKDIRKVTIDPMLGAPSDGEEKEKSDDVISFDFSKGSRSKLTIITNQSEGENGTEEYADTEAEEQSPEEAAMMANMMKPFLSEMSFSVAVKVDGSISNTNASFVDGNTITVMDFDMGKILDNNDLFTKVVSNNSLSDKEIQKQLATAGIRIETQEKVTVDFR